jgi:hypothetical protein
MNEKQSQELQTLEGLESAGTIEETQVERLAELREFKGVFEKAKSVDSLTIQKEKFREKAEKEEADRKALEAKLNTTTDPKSSPAQVDVVDYIGISTALDGLDQREKTFLAEQHRLSGKPLQEIRDGEDFTLWKDAYRAKIEKENALKPNSTQAIEDAPKSFKDKLAGASMAEKEEMLKAAGLYKEPRPRADKANIGQSRSR